MTHYGHFVAIFATGNMVGKSMIIKPGVSYLCWRASIAQYSNFFKKWCPLLQNQRKVFFFSTSADHILAHLNHSVQFGSTVATLMTIQTKWAYQRFDLDGLFMAKQIFH